MRHKKKGNHLSRTTSHKKALMRNMAAQILEHKEIKTTWAAWSTCRYTAVCGTSRTSSTRGSTTP